MDTIGFHDDEIIELVEIEGYVPVNHVMDGNGAAGRQLNPNRVLFAGFHPLFGFFRGNIPAGAGIMEGLLQGSLFFPLFFQVFCRAEAVVGFAAVHQFLADFPVDIQPFGLVIGTVVPAHFRAFIPGQAQPLQAGKNLGNGIFL